MRKMWQEGGEAPFDNISDPKGDELQKLSVIQTLPSLLAGDPQTCMRLMPKMQQTLPTASTEFHVAASSTFKTILEQRLVSHSTFTQTFLQSILNSLDSRDQIVAQAWLETLVDVIELLPTEVIKKEILPTAINKGQLSQPLTSRMMCCKLLGKICTRFDSQLIKKKVLPTVHSLCQDVNSEVRACICLQLRFVAEGLGPESLKSTLLPSIVELASDEESIVRHASIQTIVYLLLHLQPDVIKSTISPLIKKSCDGALKSDDSVMCIIAQEFGKLAVGLEKCLTASEKTWLIQYYQQLSQVGISSMQRENSKQEFAFTNSNPAVNERYVECRQLCAFNIPAMFLFASSTAEDVDALLPTFANLAVDPFYMVRRTVACGIHEVARILGPKNHLIKGELIKLLKDDNEEVLQGLIPHVARTFELLTQSQTIGTEQIDTSVMELGRALLKCEGEIFNTNNWRLSALMFEQLEVLPKCFPSDYIYTYFVPLSLDRALNARPMPVRLAAGRTFLVFIRYNQKPIQRNELRTKLYMEFAKNASCYVRMLFLRMMIEALAIFSSMYFKEYFYATVLSLTEDPIANIRLKVVTLLPTLKSYLRLPSDKRLFSNFEANVRNLMNNEKDRDVLAELTNVIRKLDEIDVRHEGQPSSSKMSKQDNEDMRKYEEEKKLNSAVAGKIVPVEQLASVKKSTTTTSRLVVADTSKSRLVSGLSEISKSPSSTQKGKQADVSMSSMDGFKASRQTPGSSRSFNTAKASTSSNNLTSSWARLTSNSMLLTHLWEKIDQPDTNISNVEDSSDDYISNLHCGCYHSSGFNYPSRESMDTSSCSCLNTDPDCSKTDHLLHKHNYFDTSTLPCPLQLHTKETRHEYLHNYFLPRENYSHDESKKPNITALRALTNAAHYNSCWAFSSMPEIPVTLLDDEFLVDTGMRIPAQLSSSQSSSKIPNLQDIIYRNTRTGNVNKSRRYSVNLDKYKRDGGNYFPPLAYPPYIRIYPTSGVPAKRMSMNYEDPGTRSKLDDDLKAKRSSFVSRKSYLGLESTQKSMDDKVKRTNVLTQSRGIIDKTKRHSAVPPELKDNKERFKRHSLEVTDYNPIERNKLKKNFTLDVNHNQGSSKIPLRHSAASGSRTAPVTRASSPIRMGPQLSFDREDTPENYCTEKSMSRFSSSDEEVDKLCIRFAYVDSSYIREETPRKSKLPVWVPRKKP